MRALAVIACVLAGCRDQAPAPVPAAPARAEVADPWSVAAAAPVTSGAREHRALAALARVSSIEPQLARLRELRFERPVPTELQSTAEFRKFVHDETEKELPPRRAEDESAALAHIGLLAKPTNIARAAEDAFVTQAAAYYDPAAKKFFVVAAPDNDVMLDTISAHELTHALQDQHFGLAKYFPANADGSSPLDDDAALARRFVVEGDATFTMILYAIAPVDNGPAPALMQALVRGQIESFGTMDAKAFQDMMHVQPSTDPGIKDAVDAMANIPPILLVPLMDSYLKGAALAQVAYERGGWRAVDDLFRVPPESTEQVLHPATKLYPVRDRPRRVAVPKLAGYTELKRNVVGELQWSVYFSLWKHLGDDHVAENWGGDRYVVDRASDGRLVALIATIWDTEADAKRFADAYVSSLPARFPGADTTDPAHGVARPGGTVIVRRIGDRVFIVDGAGDLAMMTRLVTGATFR